MDYTLDEQLDDLCVVIKKHLADGTDAAALEHLMVAQKTLLECMLIGKHLDESNKPPHACGPGGCGHHEG